MTDVQVATWSSRTVLDDLEELCDNPVVFARMLEDHELFEAAVRLRDLMKAATDAEPKRMSRRQELRHLLSMLAPVCLTFPDGREERTNDEPTR